MGALKNLKAADPEIFKAVKNELKRQRNSLVMIPSENYASANVLNVLGTVLNNKYSEGYPNKRYYAGNEFADIVESAAIERAKRLFKVPHANVQPYSGSTANFAVYVALCKPGDPIMGQNLTDGGHLTHGWKVNVTGEFFKSIPYHVKSDGYIDMNEVRDLAMQNRPKLIWIGATAYVREFPFEEFSRIADECGAYLVADISHIAGLVAANVHKSPVDYVHIVTTTTHKTIRGPRGAMIMVTEKGLQKDPQLAEKIDRAIFPGIQGGPHENAIAAIAVALLEASKPEFADYGAQIVRNSKALASALIENGIRLVTNGTDNHMILIDLTPFGKGNGVFAQEALEAAGIAVNKNTIPNEPASPFYPSGIRIGTPAVTSRGMKEEQMKIIAGLMADVIKEVKHYSIPDEKEKRQEYMKRFYKEIKPNKVIKQTREKVLELCNAFPLYKEIKL